MSASPVSSGGNLPSALVLVHDEEDTELRSPFPDDDEDNVSFQMPPPSIEPLSRFWTFIYLLAPLLRIGAILLPNTGFPLEFAFVSLAFFAILAAFARQIWYNLGLYVRNPDLEVIITDALARGRRKEAARAFLGKVIRVLTAALRVALSAFYLRDASHTLSPTITKVLSTSSQPAFTVAFALALIPIVVAPSLASRRIRSSAFLSIICFMLWLSCVSVSYARGTLQASYSWLRLGRLWQGTTVVALAFTSSSVLTLHASYDDATRTIINPTKYQRSFRLLSTLSVVIAAMLMIPLLVFSAYPRHPQPLSGLGRLDHWISLFHALTLLLSIPSIIVTMPKFSLFSRFRLSTKMPLSRIVLTFAAMLLALMPEAASRALCDVVLVCTLASGYLLPALIHVIMHQLKRPLSIVLPQTTYSPISSPRPLPSSMNEDDRQVDALLHRKEQSLQRKQMVRRIAWDMGVWLVLLPLGFGGLGWAVGVLAGRW